MNLKYLRIALAVLLILPQQLVLAAGFSYAIQITNYSVNGNTVNIDGVASGNPYVGQFSAHHVFVDWGDGSTSNTSTENFVDGINGNKTFAGTWSNSHTYATADEFTITVKLYHGQPNGNDASDAQDVEVVNVAPTLIVIKNVINDDGGTSVSGDFTMNVTGTNVVTPSFSGNAAGTTVELDAGSYSVDETANPNYAKTLSAECSGTIANGETKTCTITNNDIAGTPKGTLTVTKVVVNDDGGTAVVSDFPLFVGQTSVTSGSTTALDAGTYSVSETGNASYTATFSGDCDSNGSVNIEDGDTKTCTITNDDIQPASGNLTVVKVVNGGTAVVSDFPLFVNQAQVTSGVSTALAPATYTVSETTNANYTGTFSGDCNASGVVTIADGDDKTCTLTNDFVPVAESGNLTVIKVVNGGTAVVSDFPLFVNQTQVASGTATVLVPGQYTVTETTNANYTGTFSGDCDASGVVTIADGDDKTCTLTNDFVPVEPVPAQLTVTKVVVNDNGGTQEVSDFPLFIDETSVTSGSTTELDAGTYTVSETSNENYTGAFSGDCDASGVVTLAEGDEKSCTITNNDIPEEQSLPVLTVTKVVVNNNGGTSQVSDFPLHVCFAQVLEQKMLIEELEATPDNGGNLECIDVVSGVPNDFKPGNYIVTEDGNENYTPTFSGDCSNEDGSIQLGFDDVKTCTITNDDVNHGGGGGGGGGGGAGGRPNTPGNPDPSDNPDVELTASGDLVCENKGFADYSGEVANWLICEGIGHGYNDNESVFTPNDDIIYGDFSKLLARGFGVVQEPHVIGSGTDKYLDALSNLESTSGLLKKDKKLEKISVEEANALASAVAGFAVDFGNETSVLKRNKAAEILFKAVHQN